MKRSKILVSAALALCMGATAVTPAFAADNESFTFTKIGDYNADGVASVSDITALQLQLGGMVQFRALLLSISTLTVTALLM